MALFTVAAALTLRGGLDLEALRDHRTWLVEFIEQSGAFALPLFVVAAAIFLVIPFPLGSVVTASAGFLFGPYLGTALMIAATQLSGLTLYLWCDSALGGHFKQSAGKWQHRLRQESQRSPLNYVITLRLMPVLPFFVVSLLPAWLGIGLRSYVAGSLLGSVPGLFSIAVVGAGLGAVFDAGGDLSTFELMSEQMVLLLTALSILSLILVVKNRLLPGESKRH